jgi:integrase
MDKITGIRPHSGGIEIRYSHRGKRYSEFLNKPWNPTNCAEAGRIRRQRLNDLRTGLPGHLRANNPLWQEVAQDYVDYLKKHASPEHVTNVKRDINNIWLPYLGPLPIKDIAVRHVRQADQAHNWSSAKRQQNSRSIVRQVFEFAIQDDLIDENPAKKLKAVTHQRAKIDPFNAAEMLAILEQLDGEARMYFTLAFESGMRTAELLALDWADIRSRRAYLRQTLVNGEIRPMKTRTERTVILSPAAIAVLSPDIRPLEGLVFTLTRKQLWRRWRNACKAAGVRYRRPYNCRHTRASLGLSAGQTPAWLAKQLGHDLRTFFDHYADFVGQENDEEEMAKLNTNAGSAGEKNFADS